MANELIVLTREGRTEQDVSLALERDTSTTRMLTCRSVADLSARLEAAPVPIVLVDVDSDPAAVLASVAPLVRRFAETRFVVLCTEPGKDLMLEAMQVGARHCLDKVSLGSELPRVLRRLTKDMAGSGPSGRVFSVFSARGGCGATTIAVNLAEELRRKHERAVLLVDLDLDYGATSSFLGIKPQYGVADVLAGGERIDQELIRSTASDFREDFQVLASPATIDPGRARALDLSHLDAMLDTCRRAYSATVFDAPRVGSECASRLGRGSSMALVVFELAVIDVRAARVLMGELEARGVARDAIIPIANRYRKRGHMLSIADAQKALGGMEVLTVRNDFESTSHSENLGEPLAAIAPRSPARKDIRELLDALEVRLSHAA